jgi:serine/threonine protein kinase
MPGYLKVKEDSFRITQKLEYGNGDIFLGDAFEPELQKYGQVLMMKTFLGSDSKKLEFAKLSPHQEKSFKQEISTLHFFREEKHIAKILGWCENPASILMKNYTLGSLQNFIYSKAMTPRLQVSFSRDISLGILAMHRAGFVHCDLKPDNVLIDQDSNGLYCVLTDFGITQIVDDSSLLVKDFQVINLNGLSIPFAAPECIVRFRNREMNISGELIMKSDLYSFAVVIYQIFTRIQPWISSTTSE